MAATATATATATAALMLLLIFCCAYANAEAGGSLSSSTSFTDENPIKLVSDVDFEVESSSHISTSILHEPHEYDDAAASFPQGMYFKLPLLDPYLKKDGNFNHGINFAVAGASALNSSTLAKKGITSTTTNSSLLVQLDWFKSHLNTICSTKSGCKRKLANSLIVMGEIGGNDYNWALFQGDDISTSYEMVPEIVQVLKDAIKEVINLGAINVIVPGNFPVGCMSVYLALFKSNDSTMYDELQCLKHLNKFAEFHNNKLQEGIQELQKDYPHAKIVYADYYLAFTEILSHATSFGFDKDPTQKVCCGIGNNEYNFDIERTCGSKGVEACKHPYKYVGWDGFHLTQHAYRIMAKWLIKHNLQKILLSST